MNDQLFSQENQRAILDSLSAHIAILDEQGEILFVNAGWRKFAEINELRQPNFGVGINYLQVCETAVAKGTVTVTAILAGIRKVIAGEIDTFYTEYDCHGPSVKQWFEMRVSKFANHQADHLIVSHEDITTRKLAEQSVLDRETQYRTLFEGAADAIFLMEGDRFTDFNSSTLTMFACTRQQMLNATPYQFSPPFQADGRPSPEKAMEYINAAYTGEPQLFEWIHAKADGTLFDAEVRLNRLEIRGKPVILASVRDISARKTFENERALNESRLNSLLELSQKAHILSEYEIVSTALEEAERLTASQIAYLHFVNPAHDSIELVTWSERTKENCETVFDKHYPLDAAGVWADCVRTRQPVIHNDYQALPVKHGYPEGHVHLIRHASVPIFDKEEITMIIGVGNKADDYVHTDIIQMTLIGTQLIRILKRKRAEIALQEANQLLETRLAEIEKLQVQLREQAIRDSLTGLFNRRYLEEFMEKELARAARGGYLVSLVMIDIDHFKTVNDTYGHKAGDEMLIALSDLLQRDTRKGDIVCRYGGEEFMVLMSHTDSKLVYHRAEQWRTRFENLRVPYEGNTLKATLSAGVVTFLGNTDLDAAVKAVDEALYRSKAAGRNTVTVSDHFKP